MSRRQRGTIKYLYYLPIPPEMKQKRIDELFADLAELEKKREVLSEEASYEISMFELAGELSINKAIELELNKMIIDDIKDRIRRFTDDN